MANTANNSLSGRVALITGANTGIGLVTARELAARGAQVFIACRSAERAAPALAAIRSASGNHQVAALSLDLGDLASVRQCAQAFLARGLPLHLLINNAGLAGARGLTPSGFELAFGVNHVGHFLLTAVAVALLAQRSAGAHRHRGEPRAHACAPASISPPFGSPPKRAPACPNMASPNSPTCCSAAELGRRLAGSGVNTYALHPGVVASDVWRSVPWPFRSLMKLTMISTEEGAATTLHCATSPDVASETGLYYDKCRVKAPSAAGSDAALAAELWRRSEEWVG